VEQKAEVSELKTISLRRSQMDDIWALGLTYYQLFSGGKLPIKQATNLAEMVNSVLLTKFDFSPVPPHFRELTRALLAKDPKERFQLTFQGCPEKMRDRGVLGEAILYRLEQIGIEHGY
jgi:serine/threonine protein kinase